MNETNALSQIELTANLNDCRKRQFSLLLEMANQQLLCHIAKPSRTFNRLAHFLIIAASHIEEQMTVEIVRARAEMKKMHELPDQIQWDYRIAHTMGVMAGITRACLIQNEILTYSQSLLQKAGLLAFAQDKSIELPVHDNDEKFYDYITNLHIEASTISKATLKVRYDWNVHCMMQWYNIAERQYNEQAAVVSSVSFNACYLTELTFWKNLFEDLLTPTVNATKASRDGSENDKRKAATIISNLIGVYLDGDLPSMAFSLN
jgi:hypothetical protein